VNGTNIAVEAMNYSDKIGADLIVIMTDHESHLTGIFLGMFAKQIVNHSKIPVMSIKPVETPFQAFD
jgi:nucleotide-binding universal stress UspA family protein